MDNEVSVQGEGDGEGDRTSPLSRVEQLMQAHPDMRVIRSEYEFGRLEVTQRINDRWRRILVDVEHEESSQRHYPTVIISSFETPRNVSPSDGIYWNTYRYGLTTLMKLHVEDDEQVTPEVGYKPRQKYPQDFTREQIRNIERFAKPIPAQEIAATTRVGLEMLKANREASRKQRVRIFETGFSSRKWDNSTWAIQLYDGEPGHEDMDAWIAEASPLFAHALRRKGISYKHIGTKAIYALNALNKVTDAMLPGEMPVPPQNTKEPRRRGATKVSAPRRRTSRG